jgi:alkylhydroperoxidase family enzyme
MSEHLLFLQSAGSNFSTAHDLVSAVAEAGRHYGSDAGAGPESTRAAVDVERLAVRIERAGYDDTESRLIVLATIATIGSPLTDESLDRFTTVATRIGDTDLLRETAGVIFAFNTINRIADARRVPLEFRFLRELKPIRGWVERRLASLTGLAYDMSFKHQPRQASTELLARLEVLFDSLGVTEVPEIFHWLSRSPIVLEGVLEMIEANVNCSEVRSDLLREAVAIGVASRSVPGSGLSQMVDQWLPQESKGDANALREWAAPSGVASDSDLVSACRRYAWQVANAAYTITDEQIRELTALGLSDAERLDLTLATAVFSAVAIIEPISAAVVAAPVSAPKTMESTRIRDVRVQLA